MAVVGIIKAFFAGNFIPLIPGSTFERGGIVNNPVVVGTTVQRARQMKESMAKLKVALQTGASMDAMFPRDQEAELQFECDTGQTYVLANAFVAETQTIGSDGGAVDVTIAGGIATEVLS